MRFGVPKTINKRQPNKASGAMGPFFVIFAIFEQKVRFGAHGAPRGSVYFGAKGLPGRVAVGGGSTLR